MKKDAAVLYKFYQYGNRQKNALVVSESSDGNGFFYEMSKDASKDWDDWL